MMPLTYKTFKFSYNAAYDNTAIRGIDESRPWDLIQEVLNIGSSAKTLLDIGCGSGLKLIDIAQHFSWVTGLDHNPEMLKLAENRLNEHGIDNFTFVVGTADNLPFPNDNFDVVTVMLAPHHLDEIFRVLKPGGQLIIETLGEMDKRQLKDFFENGQQLRGQLSDRPEGSSKELYELDLSPRFSEISIKEGFWNTHYTKEGLLALLMSTPTVAHFDPTADKEAFERALRSLPKSQDKFIIKQHRLLIQAKKP